MAGTYYKTIYTLQLLHHPNGILGKHNMYQIM